MLFSRIIPVLLRLFLFCRITLAHRQCTECVPLQDLLAPAYGIELSVENLHSAIAFHNGSMISLGSIDTPPAYRDIFQPLLEAALGKEQQTRVLRGPRPVYDSQARSSASISEWLTLNVPGLSWLHKQTRKNAREAIPLHPTGQIVKDSMLELSRKWDLDQNSVAKAAVGLVLPSWLIGTEEARHVIEAARQIFGRVLALENPPSSSYTAAGYELCRISYDAFVCTGPGHIMTLQHDKGLSIASLTKTPVYNWSIQRVTFSARRNLTLKELIQWIDEFVDTQEPDRLIISGASASDAMFTDALHQSKLAPILDDQPPLPKEHLMVFGAAQAAKDELESQPDDCGEPIKCQNLRREADSLAGPFRPLVPSVWPSVGVRHDEL